MRENASKCVAQKSPGGSTLGAIDYRQTIQVRLVVLGGAGLGGQYGSIQGKRPQRAILTGRPLWVSIAGALSAQSPGNGLEILPISRL